MREPRKDEAETKILSFRPVGSTSRKDFPKEVVLPWKSTKRMVERALAEGRETSCSKEIRSSRHRNTKKGAKMGGKSRYVKMIKIVLGSTF